MGFHKHCWHHVADRGGQDVYACCGFVPAPADDDAAIQLCGATLLPRPGVVLEVKTHGVLYKNDLVKFAREAVKQASQG